MFKAQWKAENAVGVKMSVFTNGFAHYSVKKFVTGSISDFRRDKTPLRGSVPLSSKVVIAQLIG